LGTESRPRSSHGHGPLMAFGGIPVPVRPRERKIGGIRRHEPARIAEIVKKGVGGRPQPFDCQLRGNTQSISPLSDRVQISKDVALIAGAGMRQDDPHTTVPMKSIQILKQTASAIAMTSADAVRVLWEPIVGRVVVDCRCGCDQSGVVATLAASTQRIGTRNTNPSADVLAHTARTRRFDVDTATMHASTRFATDVVCGLNHAGHSRLVRLEVR